MKTLSLIILYLFAGTIYAQEIQEKEIITEVNEVTVFIEGAQVTRQKDIELTKGTTILKFVNLSPFIDAKSVQLKANGEVTVLSVNHQQNYIDKLKKSKEVEAIEEKITAISAKIELERTYVSILNEEFAFLNENRAIGGKNSELNLANLKAASDYYRDKITAIKLKQMERNETITDLAKQKINLENQFRSFSSKKEFPTGEVLVKLSLKEIAKVKFELTYFVENAGWFPTYDIRANTINEPIEIIYKANLRQDTKVDWNNVKLKFSSSNPNVSGVAPELETYHLGYNTRPPVYKMNNNTVSGQVFDQDNNPLPGANVMVPGTSIGTVTNTNGSYSITLPSNASELSYSFIGFETKTLPVTGSVMNVLLKESIMALDEVVAVGYGAVENFEFNDVVQGRMAGVSLRGAPSLRSKKAESAPIPFERIENQTSVDFEIKTPYTVKSDNKNYVVDMAAYEVPAMFQYFSVPKIDKDAFLIANITDWEQYNLLEGEANVFFEGTYIGKTLLDVRFASDTLQLSLGRDKNVTVQREKVKDHTTRQFIGTKKEETRAWEITVKNNKSQTINMLVLDQIPISKFEEIEVEAIVISKAKFNEENGEVKWEFTLDPSTKKELELKYSVKYPKSKNLIIE